MSQRAGDRRVTVDIGAVDDTACPVLHVDIDAFFAAAELRRRPDLRGRPMMVAGSAGRGVVLSATYEARAYGVRSAMPTVRALALCPGIIVLPPDHAQYAALSRSVMRIFDDFTAVVERVSIDEAFLDVAGARRSSGRPARIADCIRRRIREELDLVATVGVAANKFLAKLASTLAKPDGLLVVPPSDVRQLLDPLNVRAVPGIGPRTAARLASVGIETVADLRRSPESLVDKLLGSAQARRLGDLTAGIDRRVVTPRVREASIGAEETFAADLTDRRDIERALLQLSRTAGRRLRRAGRAGDTVILKVRFDDFTTVTRSERTAGPVDQDRDIVAAARRGWDRLVGGPRAVRLLGVRVEGLVAAAGTSRQLELGDDSERPGWREAQRTLDAIAERFPDAAPRPATLVDRATRPPKQPGTMQ